MSDAVMVAIGTAIATVGGIGAHELTHAVVALVFGRFEGFDWRRVEVLYLGYRPPGRVEYAIAGAPLAVGIALLPVLLWLRPVLPVWIAWGVYTFVGAVTNDFQFRTDEATAAGE